MGRIPSDGLRVLGSCVGLISESTDKAIQGHSKEAKESALSRPKNVAHTKATVFYVARKRDYIVICKTRSFS